VFAGQPELRIAEVRTLRHGTGIWRYPGITPRRVVATLLGGVWHPPLAGNNIANYEGFYASVFYSYFAALGYDITVEDSSNHGRLDMAVRTGGHTYLFEFKVAEMAPPGSALTQLQERDYAAKYRARGEPIHLVGVEFSRQTRNITTFDTADA